MIQPDAPKTFWDFAQSAWPGVITLLAVLVGAYITDHYQRSGRLANNKREDYQKLVDAMTKSLSIYVQYYTVGIFRREDSNILTLTEANFLEVVRSRLFIMKEIKRLNVVKRFNALTKKYEDDKDHTKFSSGVGKLIDEILEVAENEMTTASIFTEIGKTLRAMSRPQDGQ